MPLKVEIQFTDGPDRKPGRLYSCDQAIARDGKRIAVDTDENGDIFVEFNGNRWGDGYYTDMIGRLQASRDEMRLIAMAIISECDAADAIDTMLNVEELDDTKVELR